MIAEMMAATSFSLADSDQSAVAVKSIVGDENEASVVGHVPIEISRILFFALEHGCQLRAILADSKYYPSPLVQGGLEIKVDVICDWTDGGIKKLKSIVEQKYSLDTRMKKKNNFKTIVILIILYHNCNMMINPNPKPHIRHHTDH